MIDQKIIEEASKSVKEYVKENAEEIVDKILVSITDAYITGFSYAVTLLENKEENENE